MARLTTADCGTAKASITLLAFVRVGTRVVDVRARIRQVPARGASATVGRLLRLALAFAVAGAAVSACGSQGGLGCEREHSEKSSVLGRYPEGQDESDVFLTRLLSDKELGLCGDVLMWPHDRMPATIVFEPRETSYRVFVAVSIVDLRVVTREQYRRFLSSRGASEAVLDGEDNPSWPALVSRDEALQYATWAGRRMATSQELARAASAIDGGGVRVVGPDGLWKVGEIVPSRGTAAHPALRSRRIDVTESEWCDPGNWGENPPWPLFWVVEGENQVRGEVRRPIEGNERHPFRCATGL